MLYSTVHYEIVSGMISKQNPTVSKAIEARLNNRAEQESVLPLASLCYLKECMNSLSIMRCCRFNQENGKFRLFKRRAWGIKNLGKSKMWWGILLSTLNTFRNTFERHTGGNIQSLIKFFVKMFLKNTFFIQICRGRRITRSLPIFQSVENWYIA